MIFVQFGIIFRPTQRLNAVPWALVGPGWPCWIELQMMRNFRRTYEDLNFLDMGSMSYMIIYVHVFCQGISAKCVISLLISRLKKPLVDQYQGASFWTWVVIICRGQPEDAWNNSGASVADFWVFIKSSEFSNISPWIIGITVCFSRLVSRALIMWNASYMARQTIVIGLGWYGVQALVALLCQMISETCYCFPVETWLGESWKCPPSATLLYKSLFWSI